MRDTDVGMDSTGSSPDFWQQYRDTLEELAHTRDRDDAIAQLQGIARATSPVPPIDLLSKIADTLIGWKDVGGAKKVFARILNLDPSHRETWKQLSSLYFREKDTEKGAFCMRKYHELGGGNARISATTRDRLTSAGRLKSLPTDRPLGLLSGHSLQQQSTAKVISLADFEERFQVTRTSLPEALRRLIQFGEHEVVDYRMFDAQRGEFGDRGLSLVGDPRLERYLKTKGIKRLYAFQEQAFEAIRSNEDVCIVAPTGNGKTEAFLLPSLLKVREYAGFGVQMIIVYPQKALAKDQLRKITDVAALLDLSVQVFDGDTSDYWRKKIYKDPPEILITNPDMIHFHLGIGKNASKFQTLLAGLKLVVLDEVHTFSGTFGSNMFFILKRLERVIGQRLQYISASATMANAQAFVSRLLDRPITIIECQNGRRGRLHFLMLAPFEGTKTLESTVRLVNTIQGFGKTLVFQDSHKRVERLYQELGRQSRQVGIHRAGLTKKVREQVEAAFRGGELTTLVATPTMELGVDIGDLTHVITPPISVNRAMQRFGRAGRKGQEALAIVVLNAEDPISHYYYQYPERYYQDIEEVFFDPQNPDVCRRQLLCAALDNPLRKGEFSPHEDIIQGLVKNQLLEPFGDSFLTTEAGAAEARRHSIRGKTHQVAIKIKGGGVIGTRAMPQAMFELHPDAIYYAGGKRYQVAHFWFKKYRGGAELIPPARKWASTSPLISMRPKVLKIHNTVEVCAIEVAYIDARIRHGVYGYTLSTPEGQTMRNLREPLSYSAWCKGILFRLPHVALFGEMDQAAYQRALHTIVHVLLHAALPYIGGQIQEIGGLVMFPYGYVLLFDQPTGSGVCAMLLPHLSTVFERAADILTCTCKNANGCPRCTFLPRCSSKNDNLDKFGAQAILRKILDNALEISLGDYYDSHTQVVQ